MTGIDYFSLEEMRCKDGTPYPVEWEQSRWRAELLPTSNVIREEYGAPISIVSGFRSHAPSPLMCSNSRR